MLGHHDRTGGGEQPTSWNTAHCSHGCSKGRAPEHGGCWTVLLLRGQRAEGRSTRLVEPRRWTPSSRMLPSVVAIQALSCSPSLSGVARSGSSASLAFGSRPTGGSFVPVAVLRSSRDGPRGVIFSMSRGVVCRTV